MEELHFTVVESNTSSSTHGYQPDVVPVVLMSICFLLGVPGNIDVVLLRPNCQHLSSLSQSLMLNLAFSDLFCLLILPMWNYNLFYSWTFSLEACKLMAYLMYFSMYGSQLTVTMLAVQRYLLVVRLKKFLELARKRLLVLRNFSNNPQTNRLVTSIIVTSFVLWVPYLTVNVLSGVAISLNIWSLWEFVDKTWETVRAVTFVNSCLNPLLYAFASYKMHQKTTTNNAAAEDKELQECYHQDQTNSFCLTISALSDFLIE
uniref:G-protein coupled receptors family 1 profile domain-containing protein n=1 Tax=Acanthochromis polyacanthus TaxID=80966 RepID=A0A3Q1FVY7_9TELE